ncbi:SprT-like domain-containing protein [Rathayibacter tanaceti]|uniref:M48 family peptidase n=2 Tax=Rathayibacter tanaceti TaxID=1671680 RepID=A0A166I342_9MICO|nr:SprT-like domain-containing protein [Rathayibacter tanaceti]KZX21554.1 SprT-like family protein [Rathayibacter tanaceti]QHC56314.1 M48 family peptidase [Rathayibacter tanaceti]TCO37176.1 SprT-like family protein [Rathayibacter tanaceti]
MADLDDVAHWAQSLIEEHLDDSWSFAFDHARTRAGACHWTRRRITVSRHLASRWSDDEVWQTLLHEVAHALAGPEAAHGPQWRRISVGLGYTGARTHNNPTADELAPWVGRCPSGHLFYRHRRPTRPLACGRCARRFESANAIQWQRRTVQTS